MVPMTDTNQSEAAAASSIQAPPVAPKRYGYRVRDHFGHRFDDPWDWLRHAHDPGVRKHMEAENAWADAIRRPSREAAARLVEEVKAATALTDVSVPIRDGDYWYFRRFTQGQSYATHHRAPVERDDSGVPLPLVPAPGVPTVGEELLVDENEWARGEEFFRLADLSPSPDGRLIAWARDTSGDERYTWVIQEASGRVVDEVVTDAGYGFAWADDSSSFIYMGVDDAWRRVRVDAPVRTIATVPTPWEDPLRVEFQSQTVPPTVAEVTVPASAAAPASSLAHTSEEAALSVRTLRAREAPGWDPAEYVEERVWVLARDGATRIPVTFIHHRDARPDGTHAGWQIGYGSYEVSYDPEFEALRLPILRRAVYAIAHVRGGGEMGRAWYVNAAPDRFRAVLAGVPFVDALTTILDASLPLTVGEWEEWGNPVTSRSVFDAMSRYTPYENVPDGVLLPAIMATTSVNDTRVEFVEPTKWVQRLREATGQVPSTDEAGAGSVPARDPLERPIILRTEMVAGHAGPSGREGRWAARCEEFAFALGQVGVTL